MVSFGLSLVTELGKQEHRNLAQWHERPSISRPLQQAWRYATLALPKKACSILVADDLGNQCDDWNY
jgi:hypothetical protein